MWAISDIVPVDFCANMIIAIAWDVGTSPLRKVDEPPRVYHCTSGAGNPLSWGTQFEKCFQLLERIPVPHEERAPMFKASFSFVMNPYWLHFWDFIFHILPAASIDLALTLSGQKPALMKYVVFLSLCFFLTNSLALAGSTSGYTRPSTPTSSSQATAGGGSSTTAHTSSRTSRPPMPKSFTLTWPRSTGIRTSRTIGAGRGSS